jgi:hypothetical protein
MSVDSTPDPELYPFVSHWFDGTRGRVFSLAGGRHPQFGSLRDSRRRRGHVYASIGGHEQTRLRSP